MDVDNNKIAQSCRMFKFIKNVQIDPKDENFVNIKDHSQLNLRIDNVTANSGGTFTIQLLSSAIQIFW